jgi:hypothetical protein
VPGVQVTLLMAPVVRKAPGLLTVPVPPALRGPQKARVQRTVRWVRKAQRVLKELEAQRAPFGHEE